MPRVRSQDKLAQLPGAPRRLPVQGRGGRRSLYVGKARVLRDRVRSYFQASRPAELHKTRMVEEIADLELVVTDSEMEALALENNLIKRHQPPYNVRLRDDKNHPYLKLTLAEAYPRLYVVRRPAEDGNAYGGPYIPASLGRRTASLVRKLFGIRTCKETLDGKRPRPCLQYQIKRCIAPCVAEICSPERYRRACEDARLFLEGRTEEVTRRLREQMAAAAGAERYEEAASLRDQVQALVRLEAPQKITTTDIEERDLFAAHVEGERAAVQVFCVRDGKVVAREGFLLDRLTEPEAVLAETLQQFYASGRYVPREVVVPAEIPDRELLEAWLAARRGTAVRIHLPQRGEKLRLVELVRRNARLAYDLEWKQARAPVAGAAARAARPRSTSSSTRSASSASTSPTSRARTSWPRWSCSRSGLPKKADYRKFRIKTVSGAPDDFASMREVVGRRYKRLLEEGKELPDLVLIDGGKGQLGAAVAALEELGLGEQPVVSLAKREELIFVRGKDAPIALPRSSPVLQLVQRVRDEAHRFAIGFHRQVRSRRTIASELDDVPGIGPAKRRKLLSAFGSVRGVRGASEAELAGVVGKATAARLRAHFDATRSR